MPLDIFQEMQMLAMVDSNSVLDSRRELRKIVDFFRAQSWQQEQIGFFSNLRKLEVKTLNDMECFMIIDEFPYESIPEDLRHDSLGLCKNGYIVFSGRFVIPVKDVEGNIMGFVGYDKMEEPKYLDSKNHGYKAKHTTFLGMERMKDYYKSDHIFVVEGPMCMAWLRESGFNSVSSLGSFLNSYAARIFRRMGNRVIFIPDGDEAGTKYAKSIRYELPQARVLRPITDKDVDDTRLGKARNLNDEDRIRLSKEVAKELRNIIRNPFYKRKFFS